jgi:enoyl-CoA hydratase
VISRRDEGAVTVLTLDRPDALNTLSRDVIASLTEHVASIASAGTVRALVITGAGEKAFSAGADLGLMRNASPEEALATAEMGHALFDALVSLPMPVIAAINGYCFGGGTELALACDIRIASENAQIGLPEVTLGIFPGWGGTQRLPRLVGYGHASEIIATGRRLPAAEAERIGLVNHVFPLAELVDRAVEMGQEIATRAPLAVAAAKALIHEAHGAEMTANLAHERAEFARMFSTDDCREGMDAFFEKRPPTFRGK